MTVDSLLDLILAGKCASLDFMRRFGLPVFLNFMSVILGIRIIRLFATKKSYDLTNSEDD